MKVFPGTQDKLGSYDYVDASSPVKAFPGTHDKLGRYAARYSMCLELLCLPACLPPLRPILFVYLLLCLFFIVRLADHETKDSEEVTKEQPVMARPVM